MNLQRMRIQYDSCCPFCKAPRPTIAHILNGCHIAPQQGRYRYNGGMTLSCLISLSLSPLSSSHPPALCRFRWEEGYGIPRATIPQSYMPLRPDIVIRESLNALRILELTIPSNTPDGLRNAREHKQNKQEYGSLITDLKAMSLLVEYDTIEIESLGHFTSATIEAIIYSIPSDHSKPNVIGSCQSGNFLLSSDFPI